MAHGLLSYAAYVPAHRLAYAELGDSLGLEGGPGARVLASHDEDSTTMGLEAARRALPDGARPGAIWFATTVPAYADKTNATAIHAALNLGHEGLAVDVAGSARGASAALRAAAADGGLAVLADLRSGRPGSADERDGADGAAAFRFGEGEAIAEPLGQAAATAEFLDRWRAPGEASSHQWEERFGLGAYRPLVRDGARAALAAAGIEQPHHVVVSSPHVRAAAAMRRELTGRVADEPLAIGYAGAADPGLRLAAVLDRAAPGQTILLVVAADGCDATVLRATTALPGARPAQPVAAQLVGGREVRYATYLTWRGLLEREPPRRPEPARPAGPPSARSAAWKFALVGARCQACEQMHAPPRRVCAGCGAVDRMAPVSLARAAGTVATFTVDRLAFSPSPPLVSAVVDFDGGGRCTLEVADAAPEEVAVGMRLEPTFRRLYSAGGVHDYFWKARPLAERAATGR